jgi:DNA invertase Pin-like site-specific DNA recombinase
MDKQGFGYIRVSTPKQGEGVSLDVQQDVISACARKNGYTIKEWFVEKETAAKQGRPIFNDMLVRLRKNEAGGIFVHKIDRSARNLDDWNAISRFADDGLDVWFAHENINLKTRGGRLSADIQAVVSSDYIRNLREETKKGQDGRLKQGIFPWRAPLGYCNEGKGKPKTIDPVTGALVRLAFELYANGGFTLETLMTELNQRGLRNLNGKPINKNTLTKIFRNPFYTGLIYIRKWHEYFKGTHEPLISRTLFDRVQDVLSGKVKSRGWRHQFLYRRTFLCMTCRRAIISERQKGNVYYRCHTKACRGTTVREDRITEALRQKLSIVRLLPDERTDLRKHVEYRALSADLEQANELQGIALQLAQFDEREAKLTDALIDRLITKEAFTTRNARLLVERQRLEDRRRALEGNKSAIADRLTRKLELVETLSLGDSKAEPEEIVSFVKRASSNLLIDRKNVVCEWVSWIQPLEKRSNMSFCAQERNTSRTKTTPKWCEVVVDAMLRDDGMSPMIP